MLSAFRRMYVALPCHQARNASTVRPAPRWSSCCMQAENGAGQPADGPAAESTAAPDKLGQQILAIEDWVSQESISMPKDTNGTLIQKFNAALQLLQMVADKVSCHPPLRENCFMMWTSRCNDHSRHLWHLCTVFTSALPSAELTDR